jgi:hypothetical protein
MIREFVDSLITAKALTEVGKDCIINAGCAANHRRLACFLPVELRRHLVAISIPASSAAPLEVWRTSSLFSEFYS